MKPWLIPGDLLEDNSNDEMPKFHLPHWDDENNIQIHYFRNTI